MRKSTSIPRTSWSSAEILARAISSTRDAAEAASHLTAEDMVRVAEEVAVAADACGLPGETLRKAAYALFRSATDGESTRRAAAEVFAAAAMLALEAEAAGASSLCGAARDFALASQEFLLAASRSMFAAEASTSGREGGDLPNEPLLPRRQAKNASWLGGDKNSTNKGTTSTGPRNPLPRCSGTYWRRISAADDEGKDLAENVRTHDSQGGLRLRQWTSGEITELSQSERDFMSYGFFGALAIFPYLKGTGGLKSSDSPCSPRTFNRIFSTWLICVGLGLVCSNRGRAMCKNIVATIFALYARAAARIAILGVTILVILYSHLELVPTDIDTLKFFLGIAALAHLIAWVLDYFSTED